MNYEKFIENKSQLGGQHGFEPIFIPDQAFDFQRHLIEWSIRLGRSAIFADCGLGKTLMQLAWAQNVIMHTNKPVLVLTPLAVGRQTVKEADKFGMQAMQCRDGNHGGKAQIVVTNYERLHYFQPGDFAGVVCDESSILKHFTGVTQREVTRFLTKMPYRLLCTATAAPNDYVELGTSSMALGCLSHSDMLKRFFRQLDDKGKKSEAKKQNHAEKVRDCAPQHYQKLAYRVSQSIGEWRLKNHAVDDFWRWVASWARAVRLPSDLGFDDNEFKLPPLVEREHQVKVNTPADGYLFPLPAFGLSEERAERKRTLGERCDFVKQLVDHGDSAVVWCDTNPEGDMLEEIIADALQVAGKTTEERKEEIYDAFASGQLRVLVIKPKIGAWGMNWQHCNHVVTFASHSYEQYYQKIRRCWRFGQKRPVTLDMVATEGEERVLANMKRKASQADIMFTKLVQHMNQAITIKRENKLTKQTQVPSWL